MLTYFTFHEFAPFNILRHFTPHHATPAVNDSPDTDGDQVGRRVHSPEDLTLRPPVALQQPQRGRGKGLICAAASGSAIELSVQSRPSASNAALSCVRSRDQPVQPGSMLCAARVLFTLSGQFAKFVAVAYK